MHACARGRREHPAWGGGGTGTVPGAASRARTAVGGLGGGDNTA